MEPLVKDPESEFLKWAEGLEAGAFHSYEVDSEVMHNCEKKQ